MSNTWILVAESSRARVYSSKSSSMPPVEIEDLVHPAGRLHEGDLVSDSPGSDGASIGQGRHVLDAETTAGEHESLVFAKELAERLDRARSEGVFDKLVLIAPPGFLGLLRESLSRTVRESVTREINKNLVRESPEALHSYL